MLPIPSYSHYQSNQLNISFTLRASQQRVKHSKYLQNQKSTAKKRHFKTKYFLHKLLFLSLKTSPFLKLMISHRIITKALKNSSCNKSGKLIPLHTLKSKAVKCEFFNTFTYFTLSFTKRKGGHKLRGAQLPSFIYTY